MKITKRSWFFRLLGLLALVLAFGVLFTGCDAITIIMGCGLVLGGVIGGALDHVFIGIIIGFIVGFIGVVVFVHITGDRSSSGSSSSYNSNSNYGSSSGSSTGNWAQNRMNSPHTCGTCTMWLSRGVCRRDDSPKSAGDSCSNWD